MEVSKLYNLVHMLRFMGLGLIFCPLHANLIQKSWRLGLNSDHQIKAQEYHNIGKGNVMMQYARGSGFVYLFKHSKEWSRGRLNVYINSIYKIELADDKVNLC